MSIREELAAELKDAIRASDRNRKDVIRQIETAVARAKSEPGFTAEIDDALYQDVIARYVKKMDKARAEYVNLGERGADMAAKLTFETEYLSRWLPEALSADETRAIVAAAIDELGATDPKDVGRVIGHVMKSEPGELDGGLVNRLVRETLGA